MKKIASLLIILLMIFNNSTYGKDMGNYQNENIVVPQFTYIWSMSAGLDINSYGKAHYSGSVIASSDTYTVYLIVSLQKYINNEWLTIESWIDSGSGQSGLIVEGYYYVDNGSYRVCSTAKVYNFSGTLLEKELFYSTEKTY